MQGAGGEPVPCGSAADEPRNDRLTAGEGMGGTVETNDATLTFGFLTTVDSPTHGVFGGYLVVDATGRPLEFHCTTPVKVSRAQQILYGATLPGHLHGRQIGANLLGEATSRPLAVLVDAESLIHVRPHTPLPVGLVRRSDSAQPAPSGDEAFMRFGTTTISLPADRHSSLIEGLTALAGAVDLSEPFERIRAAIDEAQRH